MSQPWHGVRTDNTRILWTLPNCIMPGYLQHHLLSGVWVRRLGPQLASVKESSGQRSITGARVQRVFDGGCCGWQTWLTGFLGARVHEWRAISFNASASWASGASLDDWYRSILKVGLVDGLSRSPGTRTESQKFQCFRTQIYHGRPVLPYVRVRSFDMFVARCLMVSGSSLGNWDWRILVLVDSDQAVRADIIR